MSDAIVAVVDGPAAPAAPAELAALVAGIVQTKPTTAADALALLEKLDLELVKWAISELPAVDQKLVMVVKWAVSEVEQVAASSWCVPSTPKKPSAKAASA